MGKQASVFMFFLFLILPTASLEATETLYTIVYYNDFDHFLDAGACVLSLEETIVLRQLESSGTKEIAGKTFQYVNEKKIKIEGNNYKTGPYYFRRLGEHIDFALDIKNMIQKVYTDKECRGFEEKSFEIRMWPEEKDFSKTRVFSYFIPMEDGSCFMQLNGCTIYLNPSEKEVLKKAIIEVRTGRKEYVYFDYSNNSFLPARPVHDMYVRNIENPNSNASTYYFESHYNRETDKEKQNVKILGIPPKSKIYWCLWVE